MCCCFGFVEDYYDDVTQQQVQELAILNGTPPIVPKRGRGRGGMPMTRGGGTGGPSYGPRGGGSSFGIGASRYLLTMFQLIHDFIVLSSHAIPMIMSL